MSKKRKKIVYVCACCGYVYAERGKFENLPETWECPECTFPKEKFERREV